jgi:hypothetical protein
MAFEDCVVERQVPGFPYALMRCKGKRFCSYFFIASTDGSWGLSPMLHLEIVSRNYFKCRSVAVAMYLAFADSVKRVGGASRG